MRKELIEFPFRLAMGADESAHSEPVELHLLLRLHDALRARLFPSAALSHDKAGAEEDPFADAEGEEPAAAAVASAGPSTDEVAAAGGDRFARLAYGDALGAVFAKDGRVLPRHRGPVQVRRSP